MQPSGDRIKYYRRLLNFTQADLAKKSGYSERLIRRAEAGEPLADQTARDLAAALSTENLKVTIQDLSVDPIALARIFVESYDCFGRDLLLHCEHFISDTFKFICFGDPESPLTGTWPGKAGMQNWLDIFFGIFGRPEGYRLEPKFTSEGNHVSVRYLDMFTFQDLLSPQMWVNLHFEFADGKLEVLSDEYDTLIGKEFLAEVGKRMQTQPQTPK